ncbi:NAD(P)/FAD-dependent oxidoreductase [Solimonas terrae]|uniref:FAD-dependent oxidoreductase n=1 Tax=Solimonas terrae TaxID=1396819 RepID=A0A6M2BTB9_9GAMM|nr:FAD-dependent oxidoreductase [Solimonas terrae]NGY05465.1 FAD-dependent oxidoreductase [Solimonas terrae]
MTNNTTKADVLIVGAGQAGGDLASGLRQQGYTGRIVLVGEEPYVPYRRPPLSKTFLSGEATLESLFIKPQSVFDKHNIECMFGTGVESIDRETRTARLYDGTTMEYGKLVLATGGRPRRLSLPGADHPNVHYVRTIADILKLKEQFEAGKRLVIIGGGYIGLEAASVGIKKGLKVTVVEALPRVLARVTAPEISAFYERVHRSRGVDLKTGVGVHAFEGDALVDAVVLADGTRIESDIVIAGIGLIPNTEIAEAAGLTISNGIVVNLHTQTADPDIYAIGDCAQSENAFFGRSMRLESVPNAIEQARVTAAAILGKPVPYSAVPWFWSDQYDLKLQMVGLSQGYEQIIIRGDINSEAFSAFYLKDGVVISADAVNRPQEFMIAKKLVADRVKVDAAQLADEGFVLKTLLQTPA